MTLKELLKKINKEPIMINVNHQQVSLDITLFQKKDQALKDSIVTSYNVCVDSY